MDRTICMFFLDEYKYVSKGINFIWGRVSIFISFSFINGVANGIGIDMVLYGGERGELCSGSI